MLDYIIWGAKGHSKVIKESLDSFNEYNLIAIFDNDQSLSSPFASVPLYHGSEFDKWFSTIDKQIGFIVAIGGGNGLDRLQITHNLVKKSLIPISFIHPKAIVSSDFYLNTGVQIMAGANISVNVTIGNCSIINHNSNIDHDCILGDGVHVAPGATLTGEIILKNNVFVGAGATILPRLTVGENSIIGAGSVVTKNVPPNSIVFGVPAHYYKKRNILS